MVSDTTHDLRPRKYQEEIFERSQKENVIAALDTGSGKTLIGILLIKWISTIQCSKHKLIIFLVPKVALVQQQARFLEENTGLRITRLFGDLGIDLSERIKWKMRLERCDVIVMTPQVLVNLITHSLWSLERVSLLLFDECHNTRKNHPYNTIMREYFHIKNIEDRPKIFGMTASPVWNTKDPVGSLASLETNMNSKIISVLEHVSELANYAPRPVEVVKQFPRPPDTYDSFELRLFDSLSIFPASLWITLDLAWSTTVIRYETTLHHLGPYCASLYLFLEVSHVMKRFIPGKHVPTSMDSPNLVTEFVSMAIEPEPPKERGSLSDILLLREILIDFQSYFINTDIENKNPNVVPISIPTSWCSPKLNALKDILLEFYTPNFQVIIFVEQRQMAACLSKVLSEMVELKGKVRTAHLLGQGVNSEGVSKTLDAWVGDAVKEFRNGSVNVLIATSVAEEGLDFPACDLVVRFDSVKHMVGYVQSRGRARNAASRFVVMIQDDDIIELARYHDLVAQEPEIKKTWEARQRQLQLQTRSQRSTTTTPTGMDNNEDDDEDEDEDELDASDLSKRERFIVPSTKAILTYDNSIGLLNHLCALIPRDSFTPVHKPKFEEYEEQDEDPNSSSNLNLESSFNLGFKAKVKLPASIPVSSNQLVYTGPVKGTKKEAKRAVAFLAVKRLWELDVFNEYLLPTPGKFEEEEVGGGVEVGLNAQGQTQGQGQGSLVNVNVGEMMNVDVKFPWTIGERMWLHPVYLGDEDGGGDDKAVMGLVTGTPLPQVEVYSDVILRLGQPQLLKFDSVSDREVEEDEDDDDEKRELMHEYTKLGLFYRITGSPLANRLGVYLIPLVEGSYEVDFEQIRRVVDNPRGIEDWTKVDEERIGLGRLLVLNRHEYGRTRVLKRIRNDLTPLSIPEIGSIEALAFSNSYSTSTSSSTPASTYYDYWAKKWTRKTGVLNLSKDGPLLEAPRLMKHATSRYSNSLDSDSYRIPLIIPDHNHKKVSTIVPLRSCSWVDMKPSTIRSFELLPSLCRKITDLYRARFAKSQIGLPFIKDELIVEALTLPGCSGGGDGDLSLGFSNQRLETLGDAVLDICTTVHLFIKYPKRHEGQLSGLRQRVVSNRFLVGCAKFVGLEEFISSERVGVGKWPFVESSTSSLDAGKDKDKDKKNIEGYDYGYLEKDIRDRKKVKRQIPRRGLQDCMEALIGASYLSGGIPMALKTGISLGLAFGGLEPWVSRAHVQRLEEMGNGIENVMKVMEISPLVSKLEVELGYTFENPSLLLEAVTHPSFEDAVTPSYQRLEFLGDSIIKMAVTLYLYHKFREATSHQIALPRTKSICSVALASLAIRKLNIHKYILHNSIDLNQAIQHYLPILQNAEPMEIVCRGWKYDPPKALSDVFESVVGAVFVDCEYNLERVMGIVVWLMSDVLEVLSPTIQVDPVTEILEWLGSVGCRGNETLKLRKTEVERNGFKVDGVSAVFHDQVIVEPVVSGSVSIARFVAAERALVALKEKDDGKLRKELCDCRTRMVDNLLTKDGDDESEGNDQIGDDDKLGLEVEVEEEKEVEIMLLR